MDTAMLGHNQPPADADPLRDRLTENHAGLTKSCDDIVFEATLVDDEIKDAPTAATVTALIARIMDQADLVDEKFKVEKDPYLKGGRTVDGWFNVLRDKLKPLKSTLQRRLDAYQAQKEAEELAARLEAEHMAREQAGASAKEAETAIETLAETGDLGAAIQAEEATHTAAHIADLAHAAVTAKPAEMSRIVSGTGATASRKTFWDIKELDRAIFDLEAVRSYIPTEAMEKAAKAYIKAAGKDDPKPIKGVTFFKNSTSQVRR